MRKDKPKYERVLAALQYGLTVEFPNYGTVAMLPDEQDRDHIWVRLENCTPGRCEENKWKYVGFDVPVNVFMQLCEGLPDTYVTQLTADLALNKIRRSQR